MKIGLVVSREHSDVLHAFARYDQNTLKGKNFPYEITLVYTKRPWSIHDYCIIRSDIGEISAAAATAILIEKHRPDLIIDFGLATRTSTEISEGLTFVDSVVHYDFDVREARTSSSIGEYPDMFGPHLHSSKLHYYDEGKETPIPLPTVVCASGDKFFRHASSLHELRERFGADIFDMEAAGVFRIAAKYDIPHAAFKTAVTVDHDGVTHEDTHFDNIASDSFLEFIDIMNHIH